MAQDKISFIFNYMSVYMCTRVHSPRVISNCELPDMGAENHTWGARALHALTFSVISPAHPL